MEQEDAQVLAQLKKRKIKLRIELNLVELAIKAFEEIDENDIDPLDAAPFDDDIKCYCEDEIAISTLMYQPNVSFEKKIQFVLSKIGTGDAKEITEYILKIDNSVKDSKALFDRITHVSSRMFKRDNLIATKRGKKNVYSLKKG